MITSARRHLIVRADVRLVPAGPLIAKLWLRRLITAIGMVMADVPGNPIAYYCSVPGNRGLTAMALIETSNVTLHTWDEAMPDDPGELQLDVFTCGELNTDTVLRFVAEFDPVNIVHRTLDRHDGIRDA